MSVNQPGMPEEPQEVDLILAEYLWRMEAGEQIDDEEFLAGHPEHAVALRGFLEDREQQENGIELVSTTGGASPGAPTVSSENEQNRLFESAGAMQSISVPAQLEDYTLVREIGRGGMGVVFLARQTSLNRVVALKVLLSGKLASAQAVRRFHREARAAARLNHRGIVAVHDVRNHDGLWYMVMEFISGSSLDQLIRKAPLGPRRAAECAAEIASAVHYAHTEGVLHRDLKPSNIMISPQGQSKISDFGLAKIVQHDSDLTSLGVILGTPNYMAPEQLKLGAEGATTASDVYSIGAVLYECLTGRPPFRADSALETMNQVCEQSPALPSLLNPSIPRDLETICLKCLRKNPTQRYESAEEVAQDLTRFLRDEAITARRPGPVAGLLHWCGRRPALSSLVLTALVSVTVAAFFLVVHTRTVNGLNTQLRQSVYAADMYAASRALLQNDTRQVTSLVDRYRAGDSDDVRGFEWHHLNRMSRIQQSFTAVNDYPLYSVSSSHDAKYLAVCGGSGVVAIYSDPPRHGASQSFETGQGEVNRVCFSPDNQMLATAGDDGTVRLWDFATLQEIRSIRTGIDGPVFSALFTPDGSSVLVCGSSTDIEIYRVDDGEQLATLTGQHDRTLEAIDLSQNGQRLVSVGNDRRAVIWDLPSASVVCQFREHSGRLTSVDLSEDGRLAITGCLDGTAHVWDAETGEQLVSVQRVDGIQSVAISPGSSRFAVADRGGAISLFALSSETSIETQPSEFSQIVWQAHVDRVYGLTFGHSDDELLSVARDGHFSVWTVPSRPGMRVLPKALQEAPGGQAVIDGVEFSRDSSRLVQAYGGAVLSWTTPFETPPAMTLMSAHSIELIRDDAELAVGTEDGDVVILDAEDLTERHRYTVQSGAEITQVERRSGTGKILALAHTSGTDEQPAVRRLWEIDLSNDRIVQVAQDCDRFAISHNGHLIAINSTRDNVVSIVDLRSSETATRIKHHRESVSSMTFSPDDGSLVTVGHDRSANLWSTSSWERERGLFGTGSRYDAVAMAPDGKTLATADRSGKLVLWQVATGRQVCFHQFDGRAWSLEFSPSGCQLALVRSDDSIVLLDGSPD